MELQPLWAVLVVLGTAFVAEDRNGVSGFSREDKRHYRDKVIEMFYHAYNSYMDHAYPADELMPLTCKGRVRGQDKSRGHVDEALGRFSLTLIDTLDTLAVIGEVDEFDRAIRTVIRDVKFNSDLVVSVFETNIRVVGGLLGAHFAAVALREKGFPQLVWYGNQLLVLAEDLGRRLLPAFNTSTGLPYPKVNLRRGMAYGDPDHTTCTACAGTMVLEFAALSRLTGNPEYEQKAHKAMEVIWDQRHQTHNLVGTTINVHSGQWTRRESGVGAGIDSYYEYCLKSYILLGKHEYLARFEKHYDAVKKYISNGPLLVDVSMNSPTRMTKSFMDSLLAFWPGLQVLWGDLDSAIHIHDMFYHVTERHNFLPEAFTLDFKVHWPSHPLRPEFIESTYYLYKATGDPYYLDIGKSVIDNLNTHARVPCGFAALKDVKKNEHEDRMDSFVLAETFKYLYLLFAEEEDQILDMDDFVFNTEAHLLPLSLARLNGTLGRETAVFVNNAAASADKSSPPTNTDQNEEEEESSPTEESVVVPAFCPKDDRPYVLLDHFLKLVLKQCTSSRFKMLMPQKRKNKLKPPRLTINNLDFTNREHLVILNEMGIIVEALSGGRIQVSHVMQKAKTPDDADEGWYLMQDIMKVMSSQQNQVDGAPKRDAKRVRVLWPESEKMEFTVGPALFGPDLGENEFQLEAKLIDTEQFDGCTAFPNEDLVKGKIVLITRGGCLFIQKVRNAEACGAAGVIIADNVDYNSTNGTHQLPFSMSGDTKNDVSIPSVFMKREDVAVLRELMQKYPQGVYVQLTWIPKEEKSEPAEQEQQNVETSAEHQTETQPTDEEERSQPDYISQPPDWYNGHHVDGKGMHSSNEPRRTTAEGRNLANTRLESSCAGNNDICTEKAHPSSSLFDDEHSDSNQDLSEET